MLKEMWGDDYPIVKQAIAKYPTDGFVKTQKEGNERSFNIVQEIARLKQLAD